MKPMFGWSNPLSSQCSLTSQTVSELEERGFVVLPNVIAEEKLERLISAYAEAVATAFGDEIRIGSTSTKVTDFVNRGAAFDEIYILPALIEASHQVIGGPFKLSSFLARTLHPGTDAQELHVDVPRNSADWPLVGFILMIDDFRPDNGATRFIPGSHRSLTSIADAIPDLRAAHKSEVLACGTAGSLLIFNGSTWHGHSTNTSGQPRRSLQGAFIPRKGRAATDFAARMTSETRTRLSELAHIVLDLPED